MLYDSEKYSLDDRIDFSRLLSKTATGFRSNVLRYKANSEVEISLIFTIGDRQYAQATEKHLKRAAKKRAKNTPNVKTSGMKVTKEQDGLYNISVPAFRKGYIPLGTPAVHTCSQDCENCNGGCDDC